MIVAYSLRRITCAGSMGMISARNIKAPHSLCKKKERKTTLEAGRIPFGHKDTQKGWILTYNLFNPDISNLYLNTIVISFLIIKLL